MLFIDVFSQSHDLPVVRRKLGGEKTVPRVPASEFSTRAVA